MKKKNKKSELLPLKFAARRFGLPAKWLKEQARLNNLPALIADNQVLFDADILSKFLTEKARTGELPKRRKTILGEGG